jgi:hypothetical protein
MLDVTEGRDMPGFEGVVNSEKGKSGGGAFTEPSHPLIPDERGKGVTFALTGLSLGLNVHDHSPAGHNDYR